MFTIAPQIQAFLDFSSGRIRIFPGQSRIKRWVGRGVMKFCQLTARKVANAKKRGHLCDGAGLYLQVSKSGSQSWVFRFDFGGRRREMGLGSSRVVSLKQARQLAREAREHLLRGDDPIQLRNAKRDKIRAEVSSRLSFRAALDGCLAACSSE